MYKRGFCGTQPDEFVEQIEKDEEGGREEREGREGEEGRREGNRRRDEGRKRREPSDTTCTKDRSMITSYKTMD